MDADEVLAEIERGAHDVRAQGLIPSLVEVGHAQMRVLEARRGHNPYIDLPGGLTLSLQEVAAEDHLRVVAREGA